MWITFFVSHGVIEVRYRRRAETAHALHEIDKGWRITEVRGAAKRLAMNAISTPNFASQMRVAFSSMVSNTGLQLEGRSADDLEHVGGGGLLLQRSLVRGAAR